MASHAQGNYQLVKGSYGQKISQVVMKLVQQICQSIAIKGKKWVLVLVPPLKSQKDSLVEL